jgi:hypothetical protein
VGYVPSILDIVIFVDFNDPGDTWPKDHDFAAPPWARIYEHPADYYDTEAFCLPVALQVPEQMSLGQAFSLVDYLRAEDGAFMFRSKNDIVQRLDHRKREEVITVTTGDEEDDDPTDTKGGAVVAKAVVAPVPVETATSFEGDKIMEEDIVELVVVETATHSEGDKFAETEVVKAAALETALSMGGEFTEKQDEPLVTVDGGDANRASISSAATAVAERGPPARQLRVRKRVAEDVNENLGTGKKPRKVSALPPCLVRHL